MSDKRNDARNQYLTFTLGPNAFGLDIAGVREVLELTEITAVPRMPRHMRGVINLRGNAVPVTDLRLKLGMDTARPTVDTCIIITEVRTLEGNPTMGLLVDSVREVFEMAPEEVLPAPAMGSVIRSDYILGMGSQDGGFIILMDIDRVLTDTVPGGLAPGLDRAA
ncbi:Chemotaxis protein CheW [Pseudodesulfovibrio hydrargyri]|uniref:Chemotaxis protein CheW n=1 Tax=Pseudodesulfovibrio hydrargyri TaxID=2125990 RepID=A0A1J5MXB5_9BACT|nr:chemotaxis protein CheW [Pseudodesulfovibrio hydrargyri]OIQ51166.1 Chemotaxis protein CheW [Pseudodesulfovibrio hydrargyri]